MNRKGDWQQTYTGKQVWPLDPRPEEIDITDIAWALSNQCRFLGHTSRFYSVAEHSIWVSLYCPEYPLEGLLHDSSEAYLSDVPKPVKPFLNGFREIEDNLLQVIFKKYDLKWPIPKEVGRIDIAILKDEQQQLMPFPPEKWHQTTEPALGIRQRLGMSSKEAFYFFILRFKAFMEVRKLID